MSTPINLDILETLYEDLEQDYSLFSNAIVIEALQTCLKICNLEEKNTIKTLIQQKNSKKLLFTIESLLEKYQPNP